MERLELTRTVTAQIIAHGSDGTAAIRRLCEGNAYTRRHRRRDNMARPAVCTTRAIESDYEIESFLIERPSEGWFYFFFLRQRHYLALRC